MKSDINGCSQCPVGSEQYDKFRHLGASYFQYDYRHTNGKLYSGVGKTLKQCREKRDNWIKEQ